MNINVNCEKGHRQRLIIAGPREHAEGLAELLDGSSPGYIDAPGVDSQIGKCGICGSQLTATVES